MALRNMTKPVFIACLLISACSAFAQDETTAPGELKVWAELAKSEYSLCEEIYLFVVVTNPTNHNIVTPILPESKVTNLNMVLVDSKGYRDRYRGVGDGSAGVPITLAPGDTVMFPIMVVDCFGSLGDKGRLPGCILPGEYSVEIVYAKQYALDPVKIRVLDTYSRDSLSIHKLNRTMRTKRTVQEGVKLYKALYEELSNTPVQSRVATFFLIEMTRDSEHPVSSLPMIKELMHDYPTSGRLRWAFVALTRYYGENQLKDAIRDAPELLENKVSRSMLKLALHGIGKTDLFKELVK